MRGIIYDLQREVYHFIPLSLCDIIDELILKPFEQVRSGYLSEQEVFDEYVDFLLNRELAFFTDEPILFPPLQTLFKKSSLITNCIVDWNNESAYSIKTVNKLLNTVGCQHIQLRIFSKQGVAQIITFLEAFSNSRARSMELVMQYHPDLDNEADRLTVLNANHRLLSVIVASSPHGQLHRYTDKGDASFLFTPIAIDTSDCCGFVDYRQFAVNVDLFMESKTKNNCLNKKLGIDVNGNIKNCPAMTTSFGHVQDLTSITELVQKQSFQSQWQVTKDEIDECKDCEFRYMCHDCRVFTTNKKSQLTKPAKCKYDPYTATWKE